MAKAEKKDSQVQQEQWKETVDDHVARIEKIFGELDELHGKAVDRLSAAITEGAKLATTGLTTAAELHAQWRRMAFESARNVYGALTAH